MNELSKLIHRQSDTLNAHLPQIFGNEVTHFLFEPHDGVRNAAFKAILSVLEVADDLQLHRFSELLCLTISALWKSPNARINPSSLILLDCMLKNHPDLICHNVTLLYEILPSERTHYTRKINNVSEKHQYSERADVNALGHINAFLKSLIMLKNKSDLPQNEEDKVVYMDGKKTMSLVLYAGGGLQPVDIEKAYAKQFNPRADPFDEYEKLTPIIDALLKLIPMYFCQIIGSEPSADGK